MASAIHLRVFDDQRGTLAPSARSADASITTFLHRRPPDADVDVAWWEYRQAVRATSRQTHYERSHASYKPGGIVDVMSRARDTLMHRPVATESSASAAMTQYLSSSSDVDGGRTAPNPSSAPAARAAGIRRFEDRLLEGETAAEGAAASSGVLDAIDSTLDSYNRRVAAENEQPRPVAEVLGHRDPHAHRFDDDDDVRRSSYGHAENLDGHAGGGVQDIVKGVSLQQQRISTMESILSSSSAARAEEEHHAIGSGEHRIAPDGSVEGHYDPGSRTLQLVGDRRGPAREPAERVDVPDDDGILVGKHSNTNTSRLAVVEMVRDKLGASADRPHTLDIDDTARKEDIELAADALMERLLHVKRRVENIAMRGGSVERQMKSFLEQIAQIERRMNNAMSLLAIQRHEQDTLRMTHCAAMVEIALYSKLMGRLETVMEAAQVRVDRSPATLPNGGPNVKRIAEEMTLSSVRRALEIATEVAEDDDDDKDDGGYE